MATAIWVAGNKEGDDGKGSKSNSNGNEDGNQ